MRIFEVKNNLIKIFYETEDNLFLSGFVLIKDSRESYIGQIMHLESSKHGNVAIAKIIFNVNEEGVITAYSGTIPAINSSIVKINSVDFLKLIQGNNPILVGEFAEQDLLVSVDKSFLENKLVICSENQENSDLIIKTLNRQILNYGKKTVIIDTDGDSIFDKNTIMAGENFRLPINNQLINFIYEKGIEYKSARSKAILQETFLEIQYYLSTLEEKYIPVDRFIDILEKQYNESKIPELVLLKNSLIKFEEAGVFARNVSEYKTLQKSLEEKQTTVINLAYVDETIQREMIAYIYSILGLIQEDFYVFVKVNNGNSDKKLLKQMFSTKNIYTITNCSYSYKYLTELKKISKDLILFTPLMQQQDFASYNTFLTKLGRNEFIIYGKATQYMPLIVRISEKAKIMRTITSSSVTPEEAQKLVQQQLQLQQRKQKEEDFKRQNEQQQQQQQQQYMQQMIQQQQMMAQQVPQPQIYYPQPAIYPQMFAPQPYMPQMMPQQPYMTQPFMQPMYVPPFTAVQQFVDPNKLQQPVQPQQNNQEQQVPSFQSIEQQVMPMEEPIQKIISQEINEENQLTEDDLDMIEDVDIYNNEPSEIIEEEEQEEFAQTEEDDSFLDDIQEEDYPDIEQQTYSPQYSGGIIEKEEEQIPVYSSNPVQQTDVNYEKGDIVIHSTFGNGKIEKIINYGNKKLCSIYFEGTGRRLLDPTISELKKVNA